MLTFQLSLLISQEIHDLYDKENHYEKECSTLIENLNATRVENKSLSAKLNELAEEVETVNER